MTPAEKANITLGNQINNAPLNDKRVKTPPEVAEEKMEKMIDKMGALVDKHERITGEKDAEEMTETEKIRELMGARISSKGIVPDEERNKQPPEKAKEDMNAMVEKVGEKVNKDEALTGQKDTENMSEMEKSKQTYGGRLDDKGIVPEEEREKNPVEEAKEKAEELKERQGELVNKREELTGEENREAMTEVEKANADLGNYINKEGVTEEEERDQSAPERIRQRLEELDTETGRLVEDSPEEFGDSRIAPIANRLTGNQQSAFLATAKKLDNTGGPNMDKFTSTTNALIEKREDEQLRSYLSGVEDQSGVALSMYLSAAAQRHLFG
jgi:hypothetical protein